VIVHPGALALLAGSAASGGLLLHASWHAARLLRRWDLRSGAAEQLELERRTYLTSAVVQLVLLFELASLFLYVYTADALAPMFTGAMCAAGSLQADPHGYPALLLGLANFVLAGLWLVVTRADNLAPDYPLVRHRHALLLVLAPLVLAEGWLRARFLLALEPEVITSCCGSLFSREARTVGGALAALPPRPAAVALLGSAFGAAACAAAFRRWPRPGLAVALGLLSALALPAGLAGTVAWTSPYVYELPTHRCPFCLLQGAYGGVGYWLYGTLLGGAVCGMGAGLLAPLRAVPGLDATLPAYQRRLALAAAALLGAFGLLSAWLVWRSALVV
jgi:hypothetical protein